MRLITDSELDGLSRHELRIARNEIFARHGRMFSDPVLADWFNSKQWYQAIVHKYQPDVFDSMPSPLSRIENDNIRKIREREEQ